MQIVKRAVHCLPFFAKSVTVLAGLVQCLLEFPCGLDGDHVLVLAGLAHRIFGDAAFRGAEATHLVLPSKAGKFSHDSMEVRMVVPGLTSIRWHSGAIRRARNSMGAATRTGGHTVTKRARGAREAKANKAARRRADQ